MSHTYYIQLLNTGDGWPPVIEIQADSFTIDDSFESNELRRRWRFQREGEEVGVIDRPIAAWWSKDDSQDTENAESNLDGPNDEIEFIDKVEGKFQEYEEVIEESRLSRNARQTYLLHSGNFVRWIKGEFEPGGTLR